MSIQHETARAPAGAENELARALTALRSRHGRPALETIDDAELAADAERVVALANYLRRTDASEDARLAAAVAMVCG
jgi:hypothetical protein